VNNGTLNRAKTQQDPARGRNAPGFLFIKVKTKKGTQRCPFRFAPIWCLAFLSVVFTTPAVALLSLVVRVTENEDVFFILHSHFEWKIEVTFA